MGLGYEVAEAVGVIVIMVVGEDSGSVPLTSGVDGGETKNASIKKVPVASH